MAEVYDLLGVGFGPANMSLAVLIQEQAEAAEGRTVQRLFLDAKPEPAWHPDMMLEGSQLQVTVLKDMATVRNPQSRFTFLKYLQAKDRLFDFLNLRDLFPTRYEFNDYLTWVAEALGDSVRYGQRVMEVSPVRHGAEGVIDLLEVTAQDAATGALHSYRTRNLVVATGGTPWAPAGIEPRGTKGVIHSHEFIQRMATEFPDRQAPYRFVVVGGGQSGAELFLYLMERYPNAEVTATVRGHGYKPVDESDFTNEIFHPHRVDFIYNLPAAKRRKVVDSFRDVNYAVVDAPLIRRIYRELYQQKVEKRERARLLQYLQLQGVEPQEDGVAVHFEHLLTDEATTLTADALILATGYRWGTRHPVLAPLDPFFECEADGEYRVRRDYSIASQENLRAKIFLQGYCEATHGISETVLSLLPMRAQDIWNALTERSENTPRPAAV